MRFLFKPAWVAFVVVVIGFAVACYTLLAPWQFRRNAERERNNTAIAASFTNPPLPLAELVPAGTAPTPAIEWRQVTVRGRYLPADEVVVRLRSIDGGPAYEVLTAFRTDDGRTVAVDRGYIQPDNVSRIPAYPTAPTDPVTLTGRIRQDETDTKQRPPLEGDGRRQVYAVDSRQLANVTGQQVAPGYLALLGGQPGLLRELPLPDTDGGPFLSYAWQWLTFGAMALFGLVYFIRLELLQRRGEGNPRHQAYSTAAAPPPGPDPEADSLAQRYGKSRF